MVQRTTDDISFPAQPIPIHGAQDLLTPILRDGSQRLLAQAIEAEVAAYIERYAHERDARKRRLVVRNGYKDRRVDEHGRAGSRRASGRSW